MLGFPPMSLVPRRLLSCTDPSCCSNVRLVHIHCTNEMRARITQGVATHFLSRTLSGYDITWAKLAVVTQTVQEFVVICILGIDHLALLP